VWHFAGGRSHAAISTSIRVNAYQRSYELSKSDRRCIRFKPGATLAQLFWSASASNDSIRQYQDATVSNLWDIIISVSGPRENQYFDLKCCMEESVEIDTCCPDYQSLCM
jgi:hypothetical protein